jgi:hypothetical protein
MQSNPNADLKKRREDNDDDRAGFFLFPFFRGRRMEALPGPIIVGLILWFFLSYWPKPEPQVAQQAVSAPASLPLQPVAVETQRWGSSVIFPIDGKDDGGRKAAFDVAVLPKDLSWAHKSATQLSQGGDIIPETDLIGRVFTPELRDGLGQSSQVIAVGLASQEGQVQEETERAGNRARTAATWLSNAMKPETNIWLLNLGQFKKGGCPAQTETNDTSWQRPVILVGVRAQDDGVDLAQAFANAISGKSNLPSRDCYTSFELTKFR